MRGVTRYDCDPCHEHICRFEREESESGEYVLASDYDRDTQELRRDNAQLQFALEQETSAYIKLRAERDQLRAQVEAMRASLRDAAKGVHWLQAHVPMTKDAQWHAYHTRADIESALQAKP